MAIELSTITFTEQDDVVPVSGVEKIFNTGITNTLAGNDIITGDSGNNSSTSPNRFSGVTNTGTLNTNGGNDRLTGIFNDQNTNFFAGFGIDNREGTINMGDGNDTITGIVNINRRGVGIWYAGGTIDTGDGNDVITGISPIGSAIAGGPNGILNTGTGNDTIMGTSFTSGAGISMGQGDSVDTGDGDDVITGTALTTGSGISIFSAYFNSGNGNDTITGNCTGNSAESFYGISNRGSMNTGDGNDVITGNNTGGLYGISNGLYDSSNTDSTSTINTGDGDDIITGVGTIGIQNDGIINTGDGKDSLIANGGFDGIGSVFLENGKDYLKGFGSGNFNGGNGQDTLELTSGSYTVGILGTTINFTKGSIIMNTSEFEKLIAGNTTYNFNSLTNGQTIFVA
jgi:hypothetical protein